MQVVARHMRRYSAQVEYACSPTNQAAQLHLVLGCPAAWQFHPARTAPVMRLLQALQPLLRQLGVHWSADVAGANAVILLIRAAAAGTLRGRIPFILLYVAGAVAWHLLTVVQASAWRCWNGRRGSWAVLPLSLLP